MAKKLNPTDIRITLVTPNGAIIGAHNYGARIASFDNGTLKLMANAVSLENYAEFISACFDATHLFNDLNTIEFIFCTKAATIRKDEEHTPDAIIKRFEEANPFPF